jgi:hypothetical protein
MFIQTKGEEEVSSERYLENPRTNERARNYISNNP